MTIWFDMDGTIADLYAVNGWLEMLRAYNADCYRMARPMQNVAQLTRLLNLIQMKGVQIGIVSWSSKCSTKAFDVAVEQAKTDWLRKVFPSIRWDIIKVLPYGTNKSRATRASATDFLFDDEEGNRKAWAGMSADPSHMMDILKDIANWG